MPSGPSVTMTSDVSKTGMSSEAAALLKAAPSIQIRRPRAQGLFDYFVTSSKLFSEHPGPTDILSHSDGWFLVFSRRPSSGVGMAENKNSFWDFGTHKPIPVLFRSV